MILTAETQWINYLSVNVLKKEEAQCLLIKETAVCRIVVPNYCSVNEAFSPSTKVCGRKPNLFSNLISCSQALVIRLQVKFQLH